MKNIVNVLIIAGVVVLAGIIVVALLMLGIFGAGGKPAPKPADPEPTRSTSPRPTGSPAPTPTQTDAPPSPTTAPPAPAPTQTDAPPSPTTAPPSPLPPSPEPHSPEPHSPEPAGGGGGPARTSGGDLRILQVEAPIEIPFTPDEEGVWVIYTVGNGDYDPTLEMYDSDEYCLGADDDSWGAGANAVLIVTLDKGETYNILAGTYDSSPGSYTIIFRPPTDILSTGDVEVFDTTGFRFSPERSGTYTFRSSASGSNDPSIVIYDSRGSYVAHDEDSGGGMDFLLTTFGRTRNTRVLLLPFFK